MNATRVVVVGAGPAGVSVAVAARRVGLRPLVLDRATEVGASWRGRYDRLRLNTSRPLSHLPGRRFPRGTPMFPTRDQLVEHLNRHAHEDGIDLRLGTRVDRLDPGRPGWTLRTSAGEIEAEQVVVATGFENVPFVPDLPGRSAFPGGLLHASQYRNPDLFRDRAVLVVGPGCSGMEIAYDLAVNGARRVWIAVRTPPNIMLRSSPGPVPGDMIGVALMHVPVRVADAVSRWGQRSDTGDLTPYGLPMPAEGAFSRIRRLGAEPTIVDPEVIDAIKARAIAVVPAVVALGRSGVELADGSTVAPDAIIFATGYRRGLEPLVGHLGVLDDRGRPRSTGAAPAAPGLRFVGFEPRPGALGYMAKEATRTARAIVREQPMRPAAPV